MKRPGIGIKLILRDMTIKILGSAPSEDFIPSMTSKVGWTLTLFVLLSTGCSQKPMTTDIKTGETAPDFKLKDQNGQSISLDDLLKIKPYVAIVFYRSADW